MPGKRSKKQQTFDDMVNVAAAEAFVDFAAFIQRPDIREAANPSVHAMITLIVEKEELASMLFLAGFCAGSKAAIHLIVEGVEIEAMSRTSSKNIPRA